MIKDTNYYQVSGWMRTKLNLVKTELLVFAIIYGFSQDGQSKFTGSLRYLCDWSGSGRSAVISALKKLVEKKFIVKESTEMNNITFNKYFHNVDVVQEMINRHPVQKTNGVVQKPNGGAVQKLNGGGSKTEPNNDLYNIELNNIEDKNAQRESKKNVLILGQRGGKTLAIKKELEKRKNSAASKSYKTSAEVKKDLLLIGSDNLENRHAALKIYLKAAKTDFFKNHWSMQIDQYPNAAEAKEVLTAYCLNCENWYEVKQYRLRLSGWIKRSHTENSKKSKQTFEKSAPQQNGYGGAYNTYDYDKYK